MPLLPPTPYLPPKLLRNRHLHTIYPALFRRVKDVVYHRERISLPDTDFLDLDWLRDGNEQLSIFLHGLEGSTERSYIKGMVRAFRLKGWDALACNFRGCSGQPNLLLRSYHAGATEDLTSVVDHVTSNSNYSRIVLVGFSLGANLMLKYLGDLGHSVPAVIQGAVGISVPCDLAASVEAMSLPSNRIYMRRFMRHLRAKIIAKSRNHPGEIDIDRLSEMTTFYEFDDAFTAPMHGFESAEAYWRACSCISSLAGIRVPTLILNAEDDPFLSPACYPLELARNSGNLYLEIPRYGGHVGFVDWQHDDVYWSEQRALAFFEEVHSNM